MRSSADRLTRRQAIGTLGAFALPWECFQKDAFVGGFRFAIVRPCPPGAAALRSMMVDAGGSNLGQSFRVGAYRPGNIASNPLVQVPNQVAIPDPRKFTLSATFDF